MRFVGGLARTPRRLSSAARATRAPGTMVSASCAVCAARAARARAERPAALDEARGRSRRRRGRVILGLVGGAFAASPSRLRRDLARGAEGGCPPLFLAPMEGLGDRRLRRALARSTGGFDEACREFTRVPGALSQGAKPEKLLRRRVALNGYAADELLETSETSGATGDMHLLAAQLMGSNPELLEQCARILAREGRAARGPELRMPGERVTGKGAGSSLLRDPTYLYESVAAVARRARHGVRGDAQAALGVRRPRSAPREPARRAGGRRAVRDAAPAHAARGVRRRVRAGRTSRSRRICWTCPWSATGT